ncbi:MAG: Leucyl aminopeptidase [Bacteroidota bacterium]|nr:Leucyl aminopeptidase [Bacteroidota bacterium]
MSNDTKLKKAATIALKDYLGVEPEESLLVLADENMREIGMALYESGLKMANEVFYLEMKEREFNGQEPPEAVAKIMRELDVIVCPTSKSLTHTEARRRASDLNIRVGTMPGITIDTMLRCFSGDYKRMVELSNQIAELLADTTEIHLETDLGTEITLPVQNRKIIASTGILRKIGESGNMPSGEVYFAPVEGKSNGTVVFDGSFAQIGLLEYPIMVEVVDGYAKRISGKTEARLLSKLLNKVGEEARQVAEFGIGTNNKAQLCGNILEDEKVLGTVHIAFGNNISMGGKIDVPIHLDGIILNPTVFLDDEKIMEAGKLLI